MKNKKERDVVIVEKIIKYCDEVYSTHQMFNNDINLFRNQEVGFIYRNAITMPILQIGELVKNVSDEFRADNNNIPWKLLARTRDFYAHNYGALDYDVTWDTSQNDIPKLKEELEDILLRNHYLTKFNEVDQIADKIQDAIDYGELDIGKNNRSVGQER